MVETSSEQIGRGQLRCPTCGARQEWTDTCRRCRSDLSLVVSVAEAWLRAYPRALAALRAGCVAEALELARRCHELAPNSRSRRLLAVCQLLNEDWLGAVKTAASLLAGQAANGS